MAEIDDKVSNDDIIDGTNRRNDASIVFIQKIEVLLFKLPSPQNHTTTTTHVVVEAILVAMILISRIPNDMNHEYIRLMMESGIGRTVQNIITFGVTTCTGTTVIPPPPPPPPKDGDPTDHITSTTTETMSTETALYFLIVRFVTQLLHRFYQTLIPILPPPPEKQPPLRSTTTIHHHQFNSVVLFQYDIIMQDIIRLHLPILENDSPNESHPSSSSPVAAAVPTYDELLSCIQVYVQYLYQRCCVSYHHVNSNTHHHDTTPTTTITTTVATTIPIVDSILNRVWKFLWCYSTSPSTTTTTHRIEDPNSNHDHYNNDVECTDTMNSTTMMEQTLFRFLNETSCCEGNHDNIFQMMIQCLLQCTCTYFDIQLLQSTLKISMPSFVMPAISEWWQQATSVRDRARLPTKDSSTSNTESGSSMVVAPEHASQCAYVLLSILHRYSYLQSTTTTDSTEMSVVRRDAGGNDSTDVMLPWNKIQKFLFVCISTIDNQSYDDMDSETDYTDLLWSTPEIQIKGQKTLRSKAWSCIAFMFTGIGIQKTWINGGSSELDISSNKNNNNNSVIIDASTDCTSSTSVPRNTNDSSRYGVLKHFCTILRLAAGEWKIQLTMIIDQIIDDASLFNINTSTKQDTPKIKNVLDDCPKPSTTLASSTDWTIVASISEIIIATVSYLVQFTDTGLENSRNDDAHERSIRSSPDAILHLQKSLTEVHVVATQYLELVKSATKRYGAQGDIAFIDRCVIRVFATLTTDLITFPLTDADEKGSSSRIVHDTSGPSTLQQLDALSVVIDLVGNQKLNNTYQRDFVTLRMVLGCILNVLASAHGNTKHVAMIINTNIIGDTLVSFIDTVLCCDKNTDCDEVTETMGWLCDVIELAIQLHDDNHIDESYRSQYQAMIIATIQRKIDLYSTVLDTTRRDFIANTMKTMIDCYITVCGIVTPSGADSIIIQQALRLIE